MKFENLCSSIRKCCITLFVIAFQSFYVSQELAWTRDTKSVAFAEIMSMRTDAAGYTYLGGYYKDSLVMGNVRLIGSSNNSGFIIKVDPSGNPMWGLNIKASGGAQLITSLSITRTGSIIFSGVFSSSTLALGSQTLNGTQGIGSFFVGKISPNGVYAWAKHGNGIWLDSYSRCLDNAIYLVTNYHSLATLTIGTTPLNGFGGMDVCLVKYDTLGNQLWYKTFGGPQDDLVNDLQITPSLESVIMVSSTSTVLSCDATTIALSSVSNTILPVVLKYSASGNYMSNTTFPFLKHMGRLRLACDGSSNIFVAGQLNVGTSAIGNASYTATYPTGFVSRINAQWLPLWTKFSVTTSNSTVTEIECDAAGRLYTAGLYAGDSLGLENQYLKNDSTNSSVFFCIYEPSGTMVKSKHIGGKYYEYRAKLSFNEHSYFIYTSFSGLFSRIESTQINNVSPFLTSSVGVLASFKSPFLGLSSASSQPAPKVYPNPFRNRLTIQHPFHIESLELYTVDGRLLIHQSAQALEQVNVNTTELTPGVYILQCKTKQTVYSSKLIKE